MDTFQHDVRMSRLFEALVQDPVRRLGICRFSLVSITLTLLQGTGFVDGTSCTPRSATENLPLGCQ